MCNTKECPYEDDYGECVIPQFFNIPSDAACDQRIKDFKYAKSLIWEQKNRKEKEK